MAHPITVIRQQYCAAMTTKPRDEAALAAARGDRWLPEPPLRTIGEATAHLDRLGFAVLFPADRITAPSLWEAIAGPDEVPFAAGMGPAEELVWTWKDDLPRFGAAWSGKFV